MKAEQALEIEQPSRAGLSLVSRFRIIGILLSGASRLRSQERTHHREHTSLWNQEIANASLLGEWSHRPGVHTEDDRAAGLHQPHLLRIRDELLSVGSASGQIYPAGPQEELRCGAHPIQNETLPPPAFRK